MAAWQWFNYYSSQVPVGKRMLRINLDETSLCLFQGDRKGTVFISKKRPRDGEPVQNVPRRKRRCCLTHIALICDVPELQPLLPQLVVGNEATFLVRDMAALRAACPANVVLVRQKSAWNNEFLCAQVVKLLVAALRPHLGRYQPVLLLDAVRIHTTRAVLMACNTHRVWPLLVPAKTTWLLQPLDTDAFQYFKAFLKSSYERVRVENGVADLNIGQFIGCVCDTIRSVLQGRRWAASFEKDGFGCGQAELGALVKRELRFEGPPVVASARPSDEQLACCFPKRSKVPTSLLWRPFDPAPAPRALLSGSASSSMGGAVCVAAEARLGRTRSQHRVALAASLAAIEVPRAAGAARASRLPSAKARATGW